MCWLRIYFLLTLSFFAFHCLITHCFRSQSAYSAHQGVAFSLQIFDDLCSAAYLIMRIQNIEKRNDVILSLDVDRSDADNASKRFFWNETPWATQFFQIETRISYIVSIASVHHRYFFFYKPPCQVLACMMALRNTSIGLSRRTPAEWIVGLAAALNNPYIMCFHRFCRV